MLTALCVFPLIYPHVLMLKTEREFAYALKRDRAMGLAYVHVLEELYENRLPWSSIEKEEIFSIDFQEVRALGFEGSYQVKMTDIYKPKGEGILPKYLILAIKISLPSKRRELRKSLDTREYFVFVEKIPIVVGKNEKKKEDEQKKQA